MRKANRRGTDIFSLAFLDIIACGFGAIVLLLLIVKPDSPQGTSLIENTTIKDLFSLQDKKESLDEELAKINQTNAINLYLDDNPASYSASKINKYKSLLPSLYISS